MKHVILSFLKDVTKELLLEKMMKWKKGMGRNGLRVYAENTKVMFCQLSKGQVEDSGVHLCGVCRRELETIPSYVLRVLGWWVHKRFS